MKTALIIFAGSGTGGVLRYFIQKYFIDAGFVHFPAGTLVVNVTGCLLIGFFNGLAIKNNLLSPALLILLTTGFCGGFTTFSTFAGENMNLLRNGEYLVFSSYILTSILLGIAAVFLGFNAAKWL